jgi:hypothetical protein
MSAKVQSTGDPAPAGTSLSAGALRFWPHQADWRVASTRIRCFQVIDGLRRSGADAAVYSPGETPAVLVLVKRYDAQTLERAQALRQQSGTRLVLDLCDNHLHGEGGTAQWLVRADQLRRACAAVDLVVAATPQLADVVRQAIDDATPVVVVGDALDLGAAQTRDRHALDGLHAARLRVFDARLRVAAGRRLLWFGNHGASYAGSGMEDIGRIADALAAHHRQQPLSLVVVSNCWRKLRELRRGWTWPTLYLPWSGANFGCALRHTDIALIPVQRNAFTVCKTNNRLATAFINGLAVAADGLPSYEEFRDLAVLDDWEGGLAMLMASAAQRQQRVTAASQRLRDAYAIDVIARRWLDLTNQLRRDLPAPPLSP